MKIIPPDPNVVENVKTALRILESATKAAAEIARLGSMPAVLVGRDQGRNVRMLKPGEIIEEDDA